MIELWIKNKLSGINANIFPLKAPANAGELPAIAFIAESKERESGIGPRPALEVVTASFAFSIYSLDIEEALTLAKEVYLTLDQSSDPDNYVDNVRITSESHLFFEMPDSPILSVYRIGQTYTVQYQEATS